jgi:hypothetical protein
MDNQQNTEIKEEQNVVEQWINSLSDRPQQIGQGLRLGTMERDIGYYTIGTSNIAAGMHGLTGPTGMTGSRGATGPIGYIGTPTQKPPPKKPEPLKPLNKIPEDKKHTPDVLLANLYESFDLTNPVHIHFKTLCDSLSISNPLNENIKVIVLNHCTMFDLPIILIYMKIVCNIYDSKLTDFEIQFSDGQVFKCLKSIIKTIPYFDMMLNDIQNDGSLLLTSDSNIVIPLLKIVYGKYNDVINYENYVELFETMDKYLMKEYFHIMLDSGKEYIQYMTKKWVSDKSFDKIKLLYRILKNIVDEKFITDNEFSFGDSDKLKKDANIIIKKMFDVSMGEHMTIFEDWITLFSDTQKLRSINDSKQYELLNVANIDPKLVVIFLSKLDFINDDYQEIFIHTNDGYHNEKIKYDPHNCRFVDTYNSEIIISSYFPVFKYIKLTRIPLNITEIVDNLISIRYPEMNDINITCNMNLLLKQMSSNSNSDPDLDLEDIYVVKEIYKCSNNKVKNVNEVLRIPSQFGNNIKYKLLLDKSYTGQKGVLGFRVDHKEFNVQID